MSPVTPPGETRDRVFHYVRECIEAGLPPTVREVQEALGFRAVQTARNHLERLVEDGRLTKVAGKSRSYRLAPTRRQSRASTSNAELAPLASRTVPVLGRIAAGGLREAIEFLDGALVVEGDRRGELFALRVEGESMTGAGILPGDLVVVRAQSEAKSGDIVVALVGDEATVKTLHLHRGNKKRMELRPENPEYEPIVPRAGECRILGKVIEVRRSLENRS